MYFLIFVCIRSLETHGITVSCHILWQPVCLKLTFVLISLNFLILNSSNLFYKFYIISFSKHGFGRNIVFTSTPLISVSILLLTVLLVMMTVYVYIIEYKYMWRSLHILIHCPYFSSRRNKLINYFSSFD